MARPNLKNMKDPNRYKPSHERVADSPLFKQLTETTLKEEAERKRKRDKELLKQKGIPFTHINNFVPIGLEEGLMGRETKKSNKVTIITIVTVVISAFLIIALFKPVQELTGLGFIATLLLLVAVMGTILYLILAKWVFNVEEKRKERVYSGGATAVNLGQVWGINPGGILPRIYQGRENTLVQYSGKRTLVLKVLKDSVLTTGEMADWAHYNSLEEVENILTRNSFNFTKLNRKFDISNDPLWDIKNKNLNHTAHLLGDKTEIMANILNFHYNYTRDNHKVSVTYYIIQPTTQNKETPYEHIILNLRKALSTSNAILSEVSNNEFIGILREYYGLKYLDMDTVSEYISQGLKIPQVDLNLVHYMTNDGEIVKLKEDWEPKLPNRFTQNRKIRNEKDLDTTPDYNIDIESVYGDKFLKQKNY